MNKIENNTNHTIDFAVVYETMLCSIVSTYGKIFSPDQSITMPNFSHTASNTLIISSLTMIYHSFQ